MEKLSEWISKLQSEKRNVIYLNSHMKDVYLFKVLHNDMITNATIAPSTREDKYYLWYKDEMYHILKDRNVSELLYKDLVEWCVKNSKNEE